MLFTMSCAYQKMRTSLRRKYERQEIKRLQGLPRYQPSSTGLLGRRIYLVDAVTFLVSCNEIFERQLYRFTSRHESPTIFDCGANIGMATLYWKQLYPSARILAFEPDPTIFGALVRNCHEWQLTDVELIGRAVWTEGTDVSFWPEGAHAGRVVPDVDQKDQKCITVRTVRLRDYLQGPIDLLKLDIEGAEANVLLDCADRLHEVDHLFVEYHSFVRYTQQLDSLLSVLSVAGFRVHLQPQLVSPHPFITHFDVMGMDQSVNIFAYRDNTNG